ncbi:hypothetical protein ASG37_09575 [Sphingomonas sp. Leaf407]|nr:hypothetical protein ASE97_06865 [Sphingomonas sp. Leaf42]KQT27681.1 hypothetical protein ASG37_09575 [Sphingomonas sp. Leaf407]
MPVFRVPDETTLSLCAVVVSLCFTATFLALRLRQPAERYWGYWAASGICYIVGVVGLSELAKPIVPTIGGVLFGLLGGATVLTLVGMRAFAGMPAWRWWIVVLLALPPTGYLAAAFLSSGGTTPGGSPLQRMVGGTMLTVVLGGCGASLFAGTVARRVGGWSRAVGVALLAHLPSYATVLASVYIGREGNDAIASYLRMTQPVLMVAIDLVLLAMPGMVAMERLREAAWRDGLTGLYNRRWLGDGEAARAAAGAGVAMIDLDGFKGVNDRCGHAAGDRLLVDFAAHLRHWADAHAAEVVRLGGDEFLILFMPDDEVLAATLRRHLGTAPHGPANVPPWSASIGIAHCPAGSATLQGAMQAADDALYAAKQARRSGVPFAA